MAFIAARCTQCGAYIQVDDNKEAGVCNNCGMAYITEKVIKNFNTYVTNNYNIQNAALNNVQYAGYNINDGIKRCEAFMKINDTSKAINVANEIIEKVPDSYQGHLLLLKIRTNNFSSYNEDDELNLYEIKALYDNFCVFADDSIKTEIDKKFLPYHKKIIEINNIYKEEELKRKDLKRKWKLPIILFFIIAAIIWICGMVFAIQSKGVVLLISGFVLLLISIKLMTKLYKI